MTEGGRGKNGELLKRVNLVEGYKESISVRYSYELDV